jgi:predicted TIM-barrel enzyme
MNTVLPPPKRNNVVAMVHVHCTTSVLGTMYSPLLGVVAPSVQDLLELELIVTGLQNLLKSIHEPLVHQVAERFQLRSLVFLSSHSEEFVQRFEKLSFVKSLIERALREVDIYVRNGISCVEIENVGAPYFLGSGKCPWEDLLAIYVVTAAVRRQFPQLAIGAHILSCNELEVLPIAIAHGCFFVRSEATLFRGVRPEGETDNDGNLARFFYIRNILQTKRGGCSHYPMIWSDILKKHTIFPTELQAIETWLHNITFAKLEGVIVTGMETGSNVDEASLSKTREFVDSVKKWTEGQFGNRGALPPLPVVTGSGLDFAMYKKYADFMIIGTGFKRGKYWENEVDEDEVKKIMHEVLAE